MSPGRLARDLALVLGICLAIRLFSDLFPGAGAPGVSERLGAALLSLEMPFREGRESEREDMETLPGGSSGGVGTSKPKRDPVSAGEGQDNGNGTSGDEPGSGAPGTDDPGDGPEATGPTEATVPEPTAPAVPEVPLKNAIPTTIGGSGEKFTGTAEGIYMKNRTEYQVDAEGALAAPLPFGADAAVLIVHTHSSEAYNPTQEDNYKESDPSRTEDKNYSVIRVGDELEKVLRERGVTVYHDRELYDYPSYTGAYNRSMAAVKEYMAAHPEIKIVIDLHRDALEGDGKLYKTVAKVGDTPCAQVMLLCGTDFTGLTHPNWKENFSFAIKLQRRMVDLYPTLARPLKLSQYRYNQHLAPGALIAEIGTNGNTLREAITAVSYFGECLADVLTGQL